MVRWRKKWQMWDLTSGFLPAEAAVAPSVVFVVCIFSRLSSVCTCTFSEMTGLSSAPWDINLCRTGITLLPSPWPIISHRHQRLKRGMIYNNSTLFYYPSSPTGVIVLFRTISFKERLPTVLFRTTHSLTQERLLTVLFRTPLSSPSLTWCNHKPTVYLHHHASWYL